MKILLIRPNSIIIATPVPLGLAYVAESLRSRGGHQIRILDARNDRLSHDRIEKTIREYAPEAVGISALNFESRETREIAALSKKINPAVPVVIGGPYASANRETILQDASVDVVVPGEGEATAVELFGALEHGQDLGHVPGLAFRKNGEILYTGPRPPIEDIDSLKPAWDLVDPPRYFKRSGRNSENILKYSPRTLTVFTSRGCPFSCIFCHNVFGKKFRARSAANVVEEIAMLTERYGIRELEIVDDTFNMDLTRAKAIARGIIERNLGLKITLPNGIRGDRVDVELLDLFKQAGFYRIAFAVESASPRIQALIKKQIDLNKVKWAIHETAARGMIATGYFIMGFPTETVADMDLTAQFAAGTDLHVASFFYLNPFPGTEVARMTAKDLTSICFEDYSTMSVNVSAVTDEELHAAAKRAYRAFYLNPRRIASILRVVPKNLRTLLNSFLVLRLLFQDSVNS